MRFLLFGLLAITALCQAKDPSIVEKVLPNLEGLQESFEKARDMGHDGLDKFVDTLKEQRRKIDEYYHPEKKSWVQQTKDSYESLVDKIKDWQCRAEEKAHELRYGTTAGYTCSPDLDKSITEKVTDKVVDAKDAVTGKVGDVYESAKDKVTGAFTTASNVAEDAKEVVEDKYEDLADAFNKARDEGTEGLKSLVKSVRDQREKLEGMYNDVLKKASKKTDAKSKEWTEQFKKSAGESMRSLREMGDGFEQRMQEFLGTDYGRWGFLAKLKFW